MELPERRRRQIVSWALNKTVGYIFHLGEKMMRLEKKKKKKELGEGSTMPAESFNLIFWANRNWRS